jgi:hypothetical protein
VVEALVAYRMSRRLDVAVLTSRGVAAGGPGPGGTGPVRRLRSWEVAHTAVIPGLPARLLGLPRDSLVHLHVAQAFVPEAVYAAHLLRRLPYDQLSYL